MFGKKKEARRQPRSGDLAQYGIFEVPDNFEDMNDFTMDGNDEDLEAELAALTSGSDVGYVRRQKQPRKPALDANLDAMVLESMKDINVDEDVSDTEDDPDILDELKMITEEESDEKLDEESKSSSRSPVVESNASSTTEMLKLLQERLTMYEKAEEKAKRENAVSKVRRFNRGVKTLQQLLCNAQMGKTIDETEIPPLLPPSAIADSMTETTEKSEDITSTLSNTDPEPPTDPEPLIDPEPPTDQDNVAESASATHVNQEALELLKKRQQEYKIAALTWKKAGNMEQALQHVKIAKQFDIVIAAISAGEAIDLSDMPPSPAGPSSITSSFKPPTMESEEIEVQKSADMEPPALSRETEVHGPVDLESALKERLEVYRRTKTAADSEGNISKARRYARICKQFEDALKLHSRGKPICVEDLPIPPGFSPLTAGTQLDTNKSDNTKEKAEPKPEPLSPGKTSPTKPARRNVSTPSPPSNTTQKSQKPSTRAEKQMLQLQQRQHEIKQAALKAKKDGDLELARDYLRQAKGIQPLIEASKAGLPVDMNSLPLSPVAKLELSAHGLTGQTDEPFMLISTEDCLEEATGTDEQIYENLEAQLIKQIKCCLSTRDHSKALGDVPGYNRWERLALSYTRDLDMLRVRKRDALPPPLHHYETKTYAIVQSHTDLNDGDIEISILRGTNYAREADTYVMFEFPYPSDNPPGDRTSTIKGTSNPEYQAVFPLTGIVDRNSRQCQRSFKRHSLKCQVWAKGCSLNPILCCTHPRGFFRSDSLLGTVTVKLQPLETHCDLHDSFPLLDGRKPAGGKLELKIRLRNPIVTKQIEQVTDKWLIIDH